MQWLSSTAADACLASSRLVVTISAVTSGSSLAARSAVAMPRPTPFGPRNNSPPAAPRLSPNVTDAQDQKVARWGQSKRSQLLINGSGGGHVEPSGWAQKTGG